jgi:outer membrane protein assembly factor BamB
MNRILLGFLGGLMVGNALVGQEAVGFDRLRFHGAPKGLGERAVVAEWGRFLGATDDAHSVEKPLLKEWPVGGPKKVWEVAMGEGYAGPVVAAGRVIVFHAMEGKEMVECLEAETGKRFWSVDYAVEYQDRYGFANGPRGSPVIADGVVVTLGVTSVLHGVDFKSGKVLWSRDLRAEYRVPQDFFGHGSSPLIEGGKVYVQVGGKLEAMDGNESKKERAAKLATAGVSVAAFDLKTGKTVWELEHAWGASYASPVMAELHGAKKLMVFAGGESDPPTGGLLCIDPGSGKLESAFAWRADDYISATASSPVVVPGRNRVFVSTCYPKGKPLGGAMVEYDAAFQPKVVWESAKIGVHWMTPVLHEGHLYAVDGERENNSRLVCVDAETGAEVWGEELTWPDAELGAKLGRGGAMTLGFLRGSLLRVDGAFLALGELGTLMWLDLSPKGCEVRQRAPLFYATNTWSLPVVSGGLLYVCQQGEDLEVSQAAGPRVICLDLRGE